jgi:HlyD family secretion protein
MALKPSQLPLLALPLVACGSAESRPSQARLSAVATRDIIVSASAAGVIEPVTLVEVKSKASGEIVEVRVDEGDEVRRNQLLVRVDPRIPQNAVVQAEADSVVAHAELDNADAQLARAKTLHATQAITDLEFEAAKLARATAYATLIRARRALEDAKIAYEDTEVRAPIDGVVLGRPVEVGTVIASASRDVSGGAVLLRMASLDTVQIRALVDETDIGMIQPGKGVTTVVAAYPNRPFRGEVLRIGAEAVVEQNVTMFPVLARIENLDGLLRPGMNAEVVIHIGEVRNALAVPYTALRVPDDVEMAAALLGLSPDSVRRQLAASSAPPPPARLRNTSAGGGGPNTPPSRALFGGDYVVFIKRDGAPRAVRVHTGLTDFAYTAVLSGLERGDSVYILPTAGLLNEQQRREEWIRDRVGGPLGQ